jgi:tRNA dimethylallyltransferase
VKTKVVVIVGPTASGKTSLGVEIAKKFNGEIISADARQVYKGLDIGSGKVTPEEMDGVPHHLLDIADPNEVYTAADFKRDGEKVITDIVSRDKQPIIAGGTFFYIDTLLGRTSLPDVPPNPELREKLETLSTDVLYNSLLRLDPKRAETIDKHNKVRLVRALEIIEALGSVPEAKSEELYDAFTLGIEIPKELLHQNIRARLFARLDQGMVEEVGRLHENGLSWKRLESLGLEYRYIAEYLQEKVTKEEMLEKLETEIRHFAKRQMTWLRQDNAIHWFRPEEKERIYDEIQAFLH